MNKKVYQNINLTCVFQNTNPNFVNIGFNQQGSVKTPSITPNPDKVISGMLSPTADGNVLFQETLPRKRDIRNSRLYEGQLLNVVRRKDGLYYPFMKAFKPEDIQDKSAFAFKIYSELSEALNSIE